MTVRPLLCLVSVATFLCTAVASRAGFAKDDAPLPELTPRQESREKAFIQAHYFDSVCFRKARSVAPLVKGGREGMIVPAYTVELGLDDPTPDGKLHEIDVAEDHRLAYFQESAGIRDSQSSPLYGPVSLETCLKDVLTYNADNCRAGVPPCP